MNSLERSCWQFVNSELEPGNKPHFSTDRPGLMLVPSNLMVKVVPDGQELVLSVPVVHELRGGSRRYRTLCDHLHTGSSPLSPRLIRIGLASLVLLLVAPSAARAETAKVAPSTKPKLFVMVVFDQMRGDYLRRWEGQFGEGGFRRLLTNGAWYQNCHYPYAGTLTGAGHASLLSGCAPSTHGIIANDWYDATTSATVNCVSSLKYERVPLLPPTVKNRGMVSPERMKALSFGDVLKQATDGNGRVVGLSFKDRSAVLPAGKTPDACYWFDSSSGTFVTSTYYHDELHPWVEKFNTERFADQWFGKDWTRLRTDLDYDKLAGPDEVKGEGSGKKQGRTFPHPMTGGLEKPGAEFYEAVYASPYGNDLLLEFAKRAIDAEGLGDDEVPDLLTISFSSNDAVGHSWGPDSQEVLDMTLRSDLIMKELLTLLDAKVGQGKYLLALSADHGVCRIPEVGQAKGNRAGRIGSTEMKRAAEEFLEAEFGDSFHDKPRWITTIYNGWFHLNQATLRSQNVTLAQAETALSNWLIRNPGIASVYTRSQILAGLSQDDVIGQRVLLSFDPERCGDVLMVLNPYWLYGDQTTGTTHGSPWGYDSHVPLLVFGTGITPGIRKERVAPLAIAPIFAHALGAKPPATCQTPLPHGLFAESATNP